MSGNQTDGSDRSNPSEISNLTEIIKEMLLEIKAMKLAIVYIACQDGKTTQADFSTDSKSMK